MRIIEASKIVDTVREMAVEACKILPKDVKDSIKKALVVEESPLGKKVLEELIKNAEIAKEESLPLCQDTGLAVLFVELGQDVHVEGNLVEAINEGVKKGYVEGYLRKSVCDPFTRKNTGDNTPAIIHLEIVPGDKLKIQFAAKGGGSENMSALAMLKPAEGIDGIKKFVRERIIQAGGNPCPPLVIGVGIGGSMERAAYLAKKALMRKVGEPNPDPEIAKLESELLQVINDTGVGPMGYGGKVTALAVHVLAQPCHIASLPVAININCHSHRHAEVII